MKFIKLVLTASLVVNAVLLAFVFRSRSARREIATPVPETAAVMAPSGRATALNPAQLAALQSGDDVQLKAMGLSDKLASMLTVGRAYAKMRGELRGLKNSAYARNQYWRQPLMSPEELDQMTKTQREFNETLDAAFSEDVVLSSESRYGYLPAQKRTAVGRIQRDYDEITSDLQRENGGTQFPSDQKKLKLLSEEKERDIAAVLSAQEFEDYTFRSSPTAIAVRKRYGDAIQSEEDYRKVFALQKAYEDQRSAQPLPLGEISSAEAAPLVAAQKKLEKDIEAALGAEAFATLKKTSDQDYKTLTSITERLKLPPQTADTIFASRADYAAASQRINADASLSSTERRTQFNALASQARAELAKTLGTEGAEVYAARAPWMSALKAGVAFTTNPKDGSGGPLGGQSSTIYSVSQPRPVAPKN